MPSSTLPAIAILTGTFLSGSALSISWFSLSILIKTLIPTTLPSTLHNFALIQSHADPIVPLTAVATSLLHWTHAYRLYSSAGNSWTGYACAGAVTFCMIPYSLVVVFPTVWKIEEAQKVEKRNRVKEDDSGGRQVEEVRGLLKRWNAQHVVRGLLPLVGAGFGVRALVGELRG